MTEYVKATDPYRVSERHVRREVEKRAKEVEGFDVLEQGRFRAGDHTSYASVRVITRELEPGVESRPYAVHDAVLVSDGPHEPQSIFLIGGDYCLTLDGARDLLAGR